jgi:hypothetical protein
MFIEGDFYSYTLLNNIQNLGGCLWRWIMIYIRGRWLPDVKWEAVMACINPEFVNGCEMGSSHSQY